MCAFYFVLALCHVRDSSVSTEQCFSEVGHVLPALLHSHLLLPFRDKVWYSFLLYGLKSNLVLAATFNIGNETALIP